MGNTGVGSLLLEKRKVKLSTGSLPNSFVAVLVLLVTIVLLAVTASPIGLTWDEPIYIVASDSYNQWFGALLSHPLQALSASAIQQYWQINHEHPPFDKVWSGLIYAAGAKRMMSEITAHRFGNILLSAGLVAMLYLLLSECQWPQGRNYGRIAGLGAVASLLSMPRFFFHAHLAALDVPTAVMMFLVCYLFWRVADQPQLGWSLALGFAAGLATATKINAPLELPVILGLWVLFFRPKPYLFARLAVMGLVGIGVWFVLWPWMYHDTFNRFREYIDFMVVNHMAIGQWFRGRLYLAPPWYFPFVMTLAVMPVTLIFLSILGVLRTIRAWRTEALGWLLIIGSLIPLAALSLSRSNIYDNGRLWMPSYPFIAGLCGIGFAEVWTKIQSLAQSKGWLAWKRSLTALVGLLLFLPQVLFAAQLYPHLLSYYSEGIGGLPGAVRLGFENTYWAESYASVLSYLNKNAPQGAMVWVEAHDVMLFYQSIGLLRKDLRIISPHGSEGIVPGVKGYTEPIEHADYAVIEYRESGYFREMVQWVKHHPRVYQITIEGVPLVAVFKN